MEKKKITSLILVLFIVLNGCGYKTVLNNDNSINIQEVETSGDKKIGYILKNDLLLQSKSAGIKRLKINLESKKIKSVKDKNDQGRVISYNITLDVNLEINNLLTNQKIEKSFIKNSSYAVSTIHSSTINSERNIVKVLTRQISDDMVNFINLNF
jgi:hypothetical protein